MGNAFFCKRCDIEKFKLSTQCADQFLKEDKEIKTSEQLWMEKLRCLDDVHSKQHGLTLESFNALIDKLEKYAKSREVPVFCKNKDLVLECLSRNPNCMLNCEKEMNEFIDCVDTVRVRKIKMRIEESQTKKKLNFTI